MATPKARISLLDPKLDFPAPTRPTLTYAIASVKRTGSTFLCQQLWQTGVLGAPWEYFNHLTELLRMAGRVRVNSIGEYAQKIFDLRTSPNGVFGFKAHPEHFTFMQQAGLLRFFPKLRFIYIERRDRIGQAVSLAKARQTSQWISLEIVQAEPAYDFDLIARCAGVLERSVSYWEEFFKRQDIRPLRIVYEDLVADPQASVQRVLDRFGIASSPAAVLDIPSIERQFDDVNREWVQRYREEAKTRRPAQQ